LIIQGKIIVLR